MSAGVLFRVSVCNGVHNPPEEENNNRETGGVVPFFSGICPFGKGMSVSMDWMMLLKAFLVGGAICVVGQLLIDLTKLTPARILVLFVTLGVALTAVGLYEPLVKFAGSGAATPLTGFGYSLAKGVQEAVAEKGLIGALSGGITGTAAGIAAAIVFSFLCALVAHSGDKS